MAQRGLTPYTSTRSLYSGDPLQQFHREMDRLFDDVFGGSLMPFFGQGQQGSFGAPRLDVHETDDQLCITADVPGIKQNELDVRIDGDVLTISGERRKEQEDKQRNYHLMERSFGKFSRSVQLPFTPDAQKVEAHFADGVLTVRMPTEGRTQRARRIEVRGAESPQLAGTPGSAGSWSQGSTTQQGGGYAAAGSTMLQGERGAGSMQQSAGGGTQSVGSGQQSAGQATPSGGGQQSAGSTSRKGDEPLGNLPG